MSESGPSQAYCGMGKRRGEEAVGKSRKTAPDRGSSYLLSILSAREAAFQILAGGGALQENREDSVPSRSSLADRIVQLLKLAGQIQECLDDTEELEETAG